MTASTLMKKFAIDSDKEEGGAWTDFGDGIRVKIRRIKSKKSLDVRKELEKPYAADIRRGPLANDAAEGILNKQIAQAIVADWEGVQLEEGVDLPCTPANVMTVITALTEFRDAILAVSIDADSYRKQFLEDAVVANLPNTSAGA